MSRNFDAGAGTRNEARRRQEEQAAREAAARNRRLERESGIEKEQGELHIVVVTVLRSRSRLIVDRLHNTESTKEYGTKRCGAGC